MWIEEILREKDKDLSYVGRNSDKNYRGNIYITFYRWLKGTKRNLIIQFLMQSVGRKHALLAQRKISRSKGRLIVNFENSTNSTLPTY